MKSKEHYLGFLLLVKRLSPCIVTSFIKTPMFILFIINTLSIYLHTKLDSYLSHQIFCQFNSIVHHFIYWHVTTSKTKSCRPMNYLRRNVYQTAWVNRNCLPLVITWDHVVSFFLSFFLSILFIDMLQHQRLNHVGVDGQYLLKCRLSKYLIQW
jgi:hypothetical protein